MRTYLLHYNGKGRLVQIDNANTSSEDWGCLEKDFAREAGATHGEYANVLDLPEYQKTLNGLYYNWEISGPDGANYTLVVGKDTPQADINNAKDYIRETGDPVRLSVIRVNWI